MTIENVIGQLLSIIEISNNVCEFNPELMKNIIDFIAANFESIDKEEFKKLDIEVIEYIISNDSLTLRNENSLLEFVLHLYEENQSYSPLFEYVLFENVNEDIFHKFINKFNISYLNKSIWKSICSRFYKLEEKKKTKISLKEEKETSLRHYIDIKDFNYLKGKEFQGIMSYLTMKTGGNIHENGTIKITSNSINYRDQSPKNLVNYDNDSYYCSKDDGDAYVCFDFKDKSIQLRSYTIKSRDHDENNGHLKNWVIEVSNDGKLWKEKDCHIDDPVLNGKSIIAVFDVDQDDEFYRFVRIRQTGNSWSRYGNHNRIYFPFIEFFGKIKII